jgi:hypothetical protein
MLKPRLVEFVPEFVKAIYIRKNQSASRHIIHSSQLHLMEAVKLSKNGRFPLVPLRNDDIRSASAIP